MLLYTDRLPDYLRPKPVHECSNPKCPWPSTPVQPEETGVPSRV